MSMTVKYDGRTFTNQVCVGVVPYSTSSRLPIEVTFNYRNNLREEGHKLWNALLRMCGFKGLPTDGTAITVSIPEEGTWNVASLPYQLFRQLNERMVGMSQIESWYNIIRYNPKHRLELLHLLLVEICMNDGHGFAGITGYNSMSPNVYEYNANVILQVLAVHNKGEPIIVPCQHRDGNIYTRYLIGDSKIVSLDQCIGSNLRLAYPDSSRRCPAINLMRYRSTLEDLGFSKGALDAVERGYKRAGLIK